MGVISFSEMFEILRRYFVRVLAVSLAVAMLALVMIESIQTYTCTLNYKYNYEDAALGLAPDGISPLDPYAIQDPTLIRAALEEMGYGDDKSINVEKVRNNIAISEIVEELEQEISDSAALLGEKYTVEPVEFKIKYTYDASRGSEFGTRFFDCLIGQYDEHLLNTYYNMKEIVDFAKILEEDDEEYLDMAEMMEDNINDAIEYLEGMAEAEPDFRSRRNGYSFSDLTQLYINLRDIQYAKYYGNIRAGNLARDPEMVIKNYRAQVEELTLERGIEDEIAAEYLTEITTFYDGYKKTSLYDQAQQMQGSLGTTNNRDEGVLDNYEIDKNLNTYDNIVLSYTEHAEEAARLGREIDRCNAIIEAYTNDDVRTAEKERLINKNLAIFDELVTLSARYSELANTALEENFAHRVNEDLLYLIVTDVQADKPVGLLVGFVFVLTFGLCFIALLLLKLLRKHKVDEDDAEQESIPMDGLQRLFHQQYREGFREMHMLYQPMIECASGKVTGYEAYIRWESAEVGRVSPADLIACANELGLMPQLNRWIVEQICANLAARKRNREPMPVIHINCPDYALQDFGLADLIVKYTSLHGVSPRSICMEIDGSHVTANLADILLLQKIGVKICIDRFENSPEQDEIIDAVKPDYIKLSAAIVDENADVDSPEAFGRTMGWVLDLIGRCEKMGIKPCIDRIETEHQEQLFVMGMNFAYKQGYLYGRPELYVDKDVPKKTNA